MWYASKQYQKRHLDHVHTQQNVHTDTLLIKDHYFS